MSGTIGRSSVFYTPPIVSPTEIVHSEPMRESTSPGEFDLRPHGDIVAFLMPTATTDDEVLDPRHRNLSIKSKNHKLTSITNTDRSRSQDSGLSTGPEQSSPDVSTEPSIPGLPKKHVIHPKHVIPCRTSLLFTTCRFLRDYPCRPKPVYKVPATLRKSVRLSSAMPHVHTTQSKLETHACNKATTQTLIRDRLLRQRYSEIAHIVSRALPFSKARSGSEGGRCCHAL